MPEYAFDELDEDSLHLSTFLPLSFFDKDPKDQNYPNIAGCLPVHGHNRVYSLYKFFDFPDDIVHQLEKAYVTLNIQGMFNVE
jgi:hypothetical protein